MENEELNQVELEKNSTEENASSLTAYAAGVEAKDANGEAVDSAAFSFVQQDKSIHDTKFTTKPTTFMKDAMKRFVKNKSSVVGGVILGVLFVLALVLPMAMFSVDITEKHNYETHLPAKLLPAGTGFWDGTRTTKGAVYPYVVDTAATEESGKVTPVYGEDGLPVISDSITETYPERADFVKVENAQEKYTDTAATGYNGGYIALYNNTHETAKATYFVCDAFAFDFTNVSYSVSFELGTYTNDGEYINPAWSLILVDEDENIYSLTTPNSDYASEAGEVPAQGGAKIAQHDAITESSLNDLVDAVKTKNPTLNLTKKISIGLMFRSDTEKKTALFVKSFIFSGVKKENVTTRVTTYIKNCAAHSFGSSNTSVAAIADANTLYMTDKTTDGKTNAAYWSNNADQRKIADTYSIVADVTYDMYQVTYGLKNGIEVSQKVMDSWIADGLVEFDYKAAVNDSGYNATNITTADYSDFYEYKEDENGNHVSGYYRILDAGKNSDSVYVTRVRGVKLDTNNGQNVYTFFCQVTMYKYLGYSDIPIHIFGTEYQGKDLLKYVFSGLRTSLILGIIVSAINIIIGIIWGSISGYFGGAVDITMERITDILGGIPWIVLMTVLTIKLGTTFFVFALSLCLTGWIGTASTTRSQFYRYRDREYVLAAKTLGARPGRLIFQHILPNAIGTIVTRSVLMIPSTIFSEATISYLGLGLTSLDSLGVILSKNQQFLSSYPFELVVPAIIISLLMICFNLFGNGLRDAFNPSLKGED